MTAVPAATSSSLGAAAKTMVFGLSCAIGTLAMEDTSCSRNCCACAGAARHARPASNAIAREVDIVILSKAPPIVEESTPWWRLRLRLGLRAVIPGALPPRIAHHWWRWRHIARTVIEAGGAPA